MSTTLISIIMTFKNAESWLTECLDSILAQSLENWELIAVDDHSTDGSSSIVSNYAARDGRIKLHTNDGFGIVDALNLAIKRSSGKYITRMDADDVMPANKLKTLYSAINNQENSLATGKVSYFSSKPISDGFLDYEKWLNERCDKNDHWKWVYRECVIASGNWLLERKHVNFKPDVYPEDYAAVFQWYDAKLSITAVDEVTHLWREHPERTSRTSDSYSQKAFFDLKLEHFISTTYDTTRPLGLMGANRKFKLADKWFKAKKINTEQISLDQLHRVGELINPQILVCVYPAPELREGIHDYLSGFGLEMGRDWWWL